MLHAGQVEYKERKSCELACVNGRDAMHMMLRARLTTMIVNDAVSMFLPHLGHLYSIL